MRELRIKDLADLVVADVSDAEDRIQKMFEWHFDRAITTCQWIFGFTASLVVAVVLAFFRAEVQAAWWQIGLVVLAALGTACYGLFRLWQLRFVNVQFVAALKLYCELKRMGPFLRRYRSRGS